jgi:hypothetical protein
MLVRQCAGLTLAIAVTRRHEVYNALHERWPGNFFDIEGR